MTIRLYLRRHLIILLALTVLLTAGWVSFLVISIEGVVVSKLLCLAFMLELGAWGICVAALVSAGLDRR